jgi:hypothetical protein
METAEGGLCLTKDDEPCKKMGSIHNFNNKVG